MEAMREEVAQAIGNRLGGATGLIQEAGRAAARAKPPDERTAWDLLLLGSGQLTLGTRAGTAEAAALLGEAVSLDPGLAHAEALRALAHLRLAEFGDDPADNLRIARDAAGEAVFLDPGDAWGYAALGAIRRHEGDLVRARTEYDTALNLTPNAAEIMTLFAGWAATAGEPERGAALADRVARLDPDFPPWAAAELARAYFMAGRYRVGGGDDRAAAGGGADADAPGDRRRGARRGRPVAGGRGSHRRGAEGRSGALDRGRDRRPRLGRGRAAAPGRDHAPRRLPALRAARRGHRRSAPAAGVRGEARGR